MLRVDVVRNQKKIIPPREDLKEEFIEMRWTMWQQEKIRSIYDKGNPTRRPHQSRGGQQSQQAAPFLPEKAVNKSPPGSPNAHYMKGNLSDLSNLQQDPQNMVSLTINSGPSIFNQPTGTGGGYPNPDNAKNVNEKKFDFQTALDRAAVYQKRPRPYSNDGGGSPGLNGLTEQFRKRSDFRIGKAVRVAPEPLPQQQQQQSSPQKGFTFTAKFQHYLQNDFHEQINVLMSHCR